MPVNSCVRRGWRAPSDPQVPPHWWGDEEAERQDIDGIRDAHGPLLPGRRDKGDHVDDDPQPPCPALTPYHERCEPEQDYHEADGHGHEVMRELCDGPQLVVYANLRKEVGISKRVQIGPRLPSCTYGESQARATQAASRRLPAVQAAQAVVCEEG